VKSALLTLFVMGSACSSSPGKMDSGSTDGGPDASSLDGASADGTNGDGADDSSSTAFALCDGTQQLRLWVLVEPQFGRELPGSQLRVENGYPFLAVDGTCSYWLGGGWMEDALSRDRGARRGTLTAAEAAALEQGSSLADIGSLRDCVVVAGQADVSVRAIATATATAECPSTGTRFDGAWSAVRTLAQALWARGTPMDGALHIGAVVAPYDASTTPAAYVWPLATPLADFLLDPGKDGSNFMNGGISMRVDDPASTTELRALRDAYLADREAQPGLYTSWDGLKATDGSTTALIYMRDAIPYEDAKGLLHF
jgi:hypothetical protein